MTLLLAEFPTGSSGSRRGWSGRWGVSAFVIYDQARSICVINFANERQNDAVLGSFNMSLINGFRGTRSGIIFFSLCPAFFFFSIFFWGRRAVCQSVPYISFLLSVSYMVNWRNLALFYILFILLFPWKHMKNLSVFICDNIRWW